MKNCNSENQKPNECLKKPIKTKESIYGNHKIKRIIKKREFHIKVRIDKIKRIK